MNRIENGKDCHCEVARPPGHADNIQARRLGNLSVGVIGNRYRLRSFIAVALFFTCAQLGALGDTVILHDEVYVKGPKLFLSDVAQIEGENAAILSEVELSAAAQPGGQKRMNAAMILSRVRALGLGSDELEFRGARQVTAKTLYLDITRAMIADDLLRHIENEMPWELDQTIVEVAKPPQDYIVTDGTIEFRWRRNPQYAYLGSGTFRGELLVDGSVERVFNVRAMVQTYGQVVVAATDLRRGDPLTARNLRFETRELSTVDRGAYNRIDDVAGMLARSSHFEGQIVTNRKIMAPMLVKRNQIVVVETRVGVMTIQSRAKAFQDGAAGDIIRCKNPGTKDEFFGRVQKDGTIIVE